MMNMEKRGGWRKRRYSRQCDDVSYSDDIIHTLLAVIFLCRFFTYSLCRPLQTDSFFFHPESVCGLSLDFCRAMSPVSSRDHIRSLLDMANKHDDRIIILIDMIQIADNTARRTQTNEARVQPTQRVLPNCLTACLLVTRGIMREYLLLTIIIV